MDKIYYYNSKGVLKATINEYPYYASESPFRTWQYEYDEVFGSYSNFRRSNREFPFLVVVISDILADRDNLCHAFEEDVLSGEAGYLVIRGWKMKCFVKAGEHLFFNKPREDEMRFTIVTDNPVWTREKTYSFNSRGGGSQIDEDLNRDYSYASSVLGRQYNYGYSVTESNFSTIDVDSDDNGYRLLIYGAQVNPAIYLNNHQIKVNTEITNQEILKIVSNKTEKTIKILSNSGAERDAFIYRDKQHSPFISLDSHIDVSYSDIKFDLTIIQRRSDPPWGAESETHIVPYRASGAEVTIPNAIGGYAKEFSIDIKAKQNLNGYDNPWAGGAGKNKIDDFTETTCCEKVSNYKYKITKTGTTIGTRSGSAASVMKSDTEYTISYNADLTNISINVATRVQYTDNTYSSNLHTSTSGNNTFNFTPTKDVKLFQFYLGGGDSTGIDEYVVITDLMARVSTDTSGAFAPYENICPITGYNSTNIFIQPDSGNGAIYNVQFTSAGTVYGGTLDVVSGQLTVNYKSLTFDGTQAVTDRISSQNRVYYQISDMATGSFYSDNNVMCNRLEKVASVSSDASTPPATVIGYSNNVVYIQGVKNIGGVNITDLASFNTWVSANNIVITYPFATPLTYQLTPSQVATVRGSNKIWSDAGNVTVECDVEQ